jgi:TonB-linked SusC/RagA family outer membrane protein
MKNDEKQFLLQRKSLLFFAKFLWAGIFLFFTLSASAQERMISGTVTSVNNEPLAGVTVVVKGTTIGTLTELNGKFTLSVPATRRTLAFSFVGMTPKEVEIGTNNVYNVVLEETTTNLEEVVVVGYGTQKKISITGAIVSVASEALIKSPNASVSNSLAGRVTGLTTVQYSGKPGGDDPNIYVRGIGSLTDAASTPLMLVDGVERSFTQMDPNEIESISVLKDASSTAVYGIKGANGVIIVTTKRGQEGTPKISFTSTYGLQQPTRLVQMADSYRYAIVHNQATLSDNSAATVRFTPAAVAAFKAGLDGTETFEQGMIYPNTDWVNMLVKASAFQTQQNLNISGGSSIVKYFVSLGYLSQDGLLNTFQTDYSYNFGYQRYNYRANVDIDITKTTRFSILIGGQSQLRQEPATQPSEGMFTVLYWAVPYSGKMYEGNRVLLTNRYIATTEKKDGLNAIGWGTGYTRALSNIMNLDLGVTQNLDMVTKGLNWRFKVSNNSTAGHSKTRSTSQPTYDPYYYRDVATPTGNSAQDSSVVFRKSGSAGLLGYSESASKARNWYLETALSYARDFGQHNITGLLLYNEQKWFYPSSPSDIPSGTVGLAARATYNYSLKYMVEVNLGYNGSENFAPGNRFGFFPSVGAGWTLTEENFLKNRISFLNYLKLRFSYGIVGNDKLSGSRFLYLPDSYSINSGSYSFGTINTTNQISASEGRIGNPDVTWEKSAKQNYGIDLKLFKGKLGATVDVFFELRNNILTTRNTVPSILAFTLPAKNLGKVSNRGFEVEMRWNDNFGKVNYYLTANMSFARNKILYMDEVPKVYDYQTQTGLRVNQRFAYSFDGFWTQSDIDNIASFPNASYTPKPGDARYKDINGDNIINGDDQIAMGFPDYPEIIFSLSGGVNYKGFDFSMLWSGVENCSRVLNDTWRVAFSGLGDRSLNLWLADNSWTPETSSTATLPRISFTGATNNTKTSDIWLKNSAYVRLKNLEIGYTMTPVALKRIGISKLRISATGYDLITFDHFKFLDPEQRTSSPDYPLVKIYSLGLNVTF